MVRVGKPSGVSEALWGYTLDAAIERDPKAQKALEDAARLTAKITKGAKKNADSRKTDASAERAKRDAATDAVKASIQVSLQVVLNLRRSLSSFQHIVINFRLATLRPRGHFARRMSLSPPRSGPLILSF